MRALSLALGLLVAAALGALAAYFALRAPRQKEPDPAALVVQVREVARLETLDVTLYKKVSFEPDPRPADSIWGDVINWARYSLRAPKGKAIVFAEAHLGFDVSRFDESSLRAEGRRVELVLPPVIVKVELKPAETEVIGSNLDSAQTAELFELARQAFLREVEADKALKERARGSAERAIRAMILGLGYQDVKFVPALSARAGSG